MRRIIRIAFVLALGFLLHQLPQYNRLYVHVVKGAFYEAEIVILEYEKAALLSGKSLREYVSKHKDHADPDFQNTGKTMIRQIERYKKYKEFLALTKTTHPFFRDFILIYYFNYEIAKKVNFLPGILFNYVGLIYFVFGCLLGLGLIVVFLRTKPKPKKRFRRVLNNK